MNNPELKQFKQATMLASKPHTFLVLLHRLDGSILFKAFEKDPDNPQFLVEILPGQKDKKESMKKLKMQKQKERKKKRKEDLVSLEENGDKLIESPEVIEEETDEEKDIRMRLVYPNALNIEQANSSKTRITNYMECISGNDEFGNPIYCYENFNFGESRNMIEQVQENKSILLQNLIVRHLFLEEIKRGGSTWGMILSNQKTLQLVFVAMLVILIIVRSV